MKSHFTTNILFPIVIFNFFYCENPNQTEEKNSLIEYARTYSGTKSTRDWDDEYWDIIRKFTDVKQYNSFMDLGRLPEKRINLTEDYWHWSEDSYRIEYQKRRNELK